MSPISERNAMNQLAERQDGPQRAAEVLLAVDRLVSPSGDLVAKRANPSPLAPWRLRRVTDFIEAHLDEKLSLTDVALASGLSRMYFAALFKASTGLRPSEYIQRRRIEHAQAQLANSCRPVVDIALSVGFQSQAHFSTVFKRIVGESPLRWRQQQPS
jgi:AraC family transcriptional regulator